MRALPPLLCLLLGWNASAADNLAEIGSRHVRAHDPSTMVKSKGEYWLFATGGGIVSLRSKDLAQWRSGPRVFETPPSWTTNAVPGFRGYFWAPDIIAHSNRFLLYYSVSTWGRRTSAIGLATNPTLDPDDPAFRWTDQGIVIQTSDRDDFNAIDPAVMRDAKGRLWLALGSYWTGIKLVQLDPATGKRLASESKIHPLAWHSSIEAAFIHRQGDLHYLFVNWGQCCRSTNSTYEIRAGRSADITGPYLDRQGRDLLHGGGSLFLQSSGDLIGPGHAGVLTDGAAQWLSCHFYDGQRRGAATLALFPLQWDADGWPVIAPRKP